MSLCFLVIWKYKRDNLGVFVDVFVSTKTYFEMFEIVTVRQVALNEIHGEVVYVDFPNWIPVKRQQVWPEFYSFYPAQFLMAETLKTVGDIPVGHVVVPRNNLVFWVSGHVNDFGLCQEVGG